MKKCEEWLLWSSPYTEPKNLLTRSILVNVPQIYPCEEIVLFITITNTNIQQINLLDTF